MSWNLFIIEGTTFVWWKRVVEGQGVPVVKASQNVNHSRDNCHFGTECFQKVTKMKSRTVLHLLKLGFKVMFSDVDVYWFQVNSLPSTASHQVIFNQYKLWEDIHHWVVNHCSKGDLRYTDGHSYVRWNWNYFIGCLLRSMIPAKDSIYSNWIRHCASSLSESNPRNDVIWTWHSCGTDWPI